MLRVPSIGPITRYPVSLFKGFPLCEFLGEALVLWVSEKGHGLL
jgi:hypothetical protein